MHCLAVIQTLGPGMLNLTSLPQTNPCCKPGVSRYGVSRCSVSRIASPAPPRRLPRKLPGASHARLPRLPRNCAFPSHVCRFAQAHVTQRGTLTRSAWRGSLSGALRRSRIQQCAQLGFGRCEPRRVDGAAVVVVVDDPRVDVAVLRDRRGVAENIRSIAHRLGEGTGSTRY